MELRDYFQLLGRRWLVLALTALVGLVVAFSATDRTARYESSATLLVSPERFSLETEGANISFDRIVVIDRLLQSYSLMIQSDTVAIGAAERLGQGRSPGAISGSVRARVVTGSQLLELTATDTSPASARDIANAVARSFIDAVNSPDQSATTDSGVIPGGVPVTLFEPARVPVAPLSTGLLSNLILGGVFGLLIAAGVSIGVDSLDVTVRSVHDAERRLGVPVVGTIPMLRNPQLLLARSRVEMRRAARPSDGGDDPDGSGRPADEENALA